jgi:HlyD family secretion protein
VKQGQALARIEPSSFETRVRQEEAAVAVAKANVDLQEAGIGRADANLHKAELDLSRAKELVTKGATSQSALDTAIAAEQGAIADVAVAKANVENAKATLTQHEATLDSARIDLDRTYIRSPIDGVVIDKIVEVGQTVAASLQAPKLFTIAQDLTHVQIEAQVDEADIGQVTSNNSVSVTVDAYPDAKFEGKVEQIRLAPVSLQNVVTYTVVIAADNPQGRLLPGMTANVEIVTGEHPGVVVVPNEALRFQPRGPAEALIRDNAETGATQSASAPGDRTARLLDKTEERSWPHPGRDGQGAGGHRNRVRRAQKRRAPGNGAKPRRRTRTGAYARRQSSPHCADVGAIQKIRGTAACAADQPSIRHVVDL